MARPIRLDYPDTFYHVLSRGNERRDIFYEEKDYLKLLAIIAKMVERFNIEVHAYVLLKNHYHLLIRTKDANLSRAIQWLGVSYSVWFNRQHQRSGHLFQGRFKSFLIENEQYFVTLCLYIHGNPIRAGIVKRLLDYKWSSYQAYANKDYLPSWLTTDLALGIYGDSRERFCNAQKSYLGEENSPFNNLKYGLYLGSDEFIEQCIERVKKEDRREKPQATSLLKGKKIQTIIFKILKELGEKNPDRVVKPTRRTRRPNRDIAIYILHYLGIYTNKEIGEAFGVGYTAVTGTIKRGEEYINYDKRLQKKVAGIINDI